MITGGFEENHASEWAMFYSDLKNNQRLHMENSAAMFVTTEALLTLVITTAGQDSIQLPEKVMESYGLWMFMVDMMKSSWVFFHGLSANL